MNKWKFLSAISAGFLLSTSHLLADDFFLGSPGAEGEEADVDCEQVDQCEPKWSGSVEFGYVSVSGNTDTDSLNGRFALLYEVEKWRHGGFLTTQSSSSDDQLTGAQSEAKKITAQVKSDYKFGKHAYAFAITDYDDTLDSGFDYQASFALGAGYRFINNKVHKLDAEAGLGSRKSKTTAIPATQTDPAVLSETNTESIYRIASSYKWKISKTSNFEQKLSFEAGDENNITKSETSLSAKIIENLALKVSYTSKHQSEVPVGNENLETVSSFTVVYSF